LKPNWRLLEKLHAASAARGKETKSGTTIKIRLQCLVAKIRGKTKGKEGRPKSVPWEPRRDHKAGYTHGGKIDFLSRKNHFLPTKRLGGKFKKEKIGENGVRGWAPR